MFYFPLKGIFEGFLKDTGKHCQLETEAVQRPRIRKEAATKYYNYTAKKAVEEWTHRLLTFQQNDLNRIHNETKERQVYSQNYLLQCNNTEARITPSVKFDMRSIFPSD